VVLNLVLSRFHTDQPNRHSFSVSTSEETRD
jgi:hypothetical protein